MKGEKADTDEAMRQILKIFKKRGARSLQAAKKEILSEKIESPEIRSALKYFMTHYWRDATRPALLSLICEAVGGNAEATRQIAVSSILTSGAADIHDDIIDESKIKEIGPTVYGKFGKNIALLAGDALLFMGLTVLFQTAQRDSSTVKLADILDITKRTFFELGDAEGLELHLRRRIDVTPDECLHVMEKKAFIIEGYAQIAVILGNGTSEELENLGKYGKALGMLIMLRDDLIDMIDIAETRHRIEKEYPPLPIIYAMQNPQTRQSIEPYLLQRKITNKNAEFIIQQTREAGGIKRCQALMGELSKGAYLCLETVGHKQSYLELKLLIQALMSI